MITLTPLEAKYIIEYVEEIDAVIDADDGTLIPQPLVEKHNYIKEMLRHET